MNDAATENVDVDAADDDDDSPAWNRVVAVAFENALAIDSDVVLHLERNIDVLLHVADVIPIRKPFDNSWPLAGHLKQHWHWEVPLMKNPNPNHFAYD